MSKASKIEVVINELKALIGKKGLTYEIRSKVKEDEDTGFYSFAIRTRKGLVKADFEWDDPKYGDDAIDGYYIVTKPSEHLYWKDGEFEFVLNEFKTKMTIIIEQECV